MFLFFFFIGIWTFKLFTQNNNEIARIQLPIFSIELIKSNDIAYLTEFDYLINKFYKFIDLCIHYINNNNFTENFVLINYCENTHWSSVFPDLKSEIRYGYNKTLKMLV